MVLCATSLRRVVCVALQPAETEPVWDPQRTRWLRPPHFREFSELSTEAQVAARARD